MQTSSSESHLMLSSSLQLEMGTGFAAAADDTTASSAQAFMGRRAAAAEPQTAERIRKLLNDNFSCSITCVRAFGRLLMLMLQDISMYVYMGACLLRVLHVLRM